MNCRDRRKGRPTVLRYSQDCRIGDYYWWRRQHN